MTGYCNWRYVFSFCALRAKTCAHGPGHRFPRHDVDVSGQQIHSCSAPTLFHVSRCWPWKNGLRVCDTHGRMRYADPAWPLTTAGEELADLDHDLSDLSEACIVLVTIL